MEPVEWLQLTVPGFDDLSEAERAAIRDFAMLWSLFEGTVLGARGNTGALVAMVDRLHERGAVDLATLGAAVAHFRDRYYANGGFTPAFDQHLHFRNNDHRPLAEAFVSGATNDPAEMLKGLLIIVYRLRNNLFHGVKWTYRIQGQLENFRHANVILMAATNMAMAAGLVQY
ncbi:MAG: hypothetical protein AB7U75_17385 [Hyphomicrobiaceae bacterium]